MELDLADVLKMPAVNDEPREDPTERMMAILVQMQEGQSLLTDALVQQKRRIDVLEQDVARLRAAVAPRPVLKPGDPRWAS